MLRAGVLPMIFRNRILFTAALFATATALSLAQETSATLAGAYQPVFENDWVKVVRVHYAPRVKLPNHAHTEFAAAYVYLTDSGPIVFRHVGASYGAATRAAVKAGTFRLYRAVNEMHEVENMSDLASDFLRVEFKTEPLEAALLRGRFARDPKATENRKVDFENAQVRISRWTHGAASGTPAPRILPYPSLFVDTTSGAVRWFSADEGTMLPAPSSSPADILQFEFKTAPQR
jgi:hypothetical protein